LGSKFGNPNIGLALVAGIGVIGFAFKESILLIEKIYKSEKYATILQTKG
jgi:hypothetical protein